MSESRSQKIDPSKAVSWIAKNHSSAVSQFLEEQNQIYRAIKDRSDRYLYVKPTRFTRQSRNTTNIYTSLLDILPSWQAYPKRSKSIICSNNWIHAHRYSGFGRGKVYCVLPKNGSKIGVCPSDDFWDSFPVVFDRWDNTSNMDDFNMEFSKLMGLRDFQENMNSEQMSEFLKRAEGNRTADQFEATSWDHTHRDILKNKFERGITWVKYFDDLLNPEENGFVLTTIENYQAPDKDREIWTDGDSLLINTNMSDEKTKVNDLKYDDLYAMISRFYHEK